MKLSGSVIAGLALVCLLFAAPASAQDQGSMQVGDATVTVGGGTAILTLPDIQFMTTTNATGTAIVRRFDDSEDFGDELGWNVNGSISVPMTGANGRSKRISVNGFWANIEDDDTTACTSTAAAECTLNGLINTPVSNSLFGGAGAQVVSNSNRDVDFWGVSMGSKWLLTPNVMGVTQAPMPRYFTLGLDIRGINQETRLRYRSPQDATFFFNYNEDMDTTYYGSYAAWGGAYRLPFFSGMTSRWGLRSSFMLRGGIYYADTDYDGRTVNSFNAGANSSLSLSDDEVAFIGGLILETRKRIGKRSTLSLKSEYEYYSYVPNVRYMDVDPEAGVTVGNVSTAIGNDDAFSARTSLRLTIKLGPDSLFEEPLK